MELLRSITFALPRPLPKKKEEFELKQNERKITFNGLMELNVSGAEMHPKYPSN